MQEAATDGRARRLGVYLVDSGGRPGDSWQVPPHVFTALRGLRPFLDRLVVGVTRSMQAADDMALAGIADSVVAGGSEVTHGRLVATLGPDIADFDEVILTGAGWVGPIADLAPVLGRMADVPEWSLLPKGSGVPGQPGFTLGIDPSWYVMSGRIAGSQELSSWRAGGPLASNRPGEQQRFAFEPAEYASADPALMNLSDLIAAGLPYVPLSTFGVDPLLADRLAVVPADAFDRLGATTIDRTEVWAGLLDRFPLRVLSTNLGLTRVLSGRWPAPVPALRTAAILHIYYDDLTDELMDRVDLIPGEVDVVVTTTDEARRDAIETRLAARLRQYTHEIRIVESNRGRDISAFLVGCADVIGDELYDLVVKLHGKRSVQDDVNASTWFRRHLFDNLLPSSEGVAELYGLFAGDPSMGMAVPPIIHMFYPTMGHAWLGNRDLAEGLADRLGITVPFDTDTPVAAYGSMFVARRAALLPWLSLGLTWEDFPGEGGYADGTLAHAVERLFCYVAAQTGRYTCTALGPSVAGIEYGFLEYKLQAVGARLPAYAIDQVQDLDARPGSWRQGLVRRFPKLAHRLRPLYRALRGR